MKNRIILSTIMLSFIPLFSIANETSYCSSGTKNENYYFPPNQLNQDIEQSLEDHDRNLYTKVLSEINEPSFSCNLNERGLRFIWLRNNNNPIVIRATGKYKDRQLSITATEFKIGTNNQLESIVRQEARVLTDTERDKLRAMLARSAVLTSATEKSTSAASNSQWAFEYREEDRYYLVTKRSPAASDDLRKIGIYILELTGWKFSDNEIY
jgi:hypothetical protein